MHSAKIPPVDPAPATITAVLAMHAGHIRPSFELLIPVPFAASLSSRYNLVLGAHKINLTLNVEMPGVTSVAGFQNQRRAGSTWTR